MGNVLEQESITTEDADTTEDDLKWLAVSAVGLDMSLASHTLHKKYYCCTAVVLLVVLVVLVLSQQERGPRETQP